MSEQRQIVDYVEAALLSQLRQRINDLHTAFENQRNQIQRLGVFIGKIPEFPPLGESFERLVKAGIYDVIADDFAGNFYAINKVKVIEATDELNSDSNSICSKITRVGLAFLNAAMSAYEANPDDFGKIEYKSLDAPASDRIVKITDNQILEVDVATESLIAVLDDQNGIDGDIELKDRIIGQIKAGRELVRAGSVRAYLLYETVATVLSHLIEKYSGTAIAETAKVLFTLYVERILNQ